MATRLGLTSDMVVGELGFIEDIAESLRADIEAATGHPLEGEDSDEILDAVLVWFRDDDDDLTDMLVDAITLLAEDGEVWLATPRSGFDGYVDPGDIDDAARTAGLSQSSAGPTVDAWMVTKLLRGRASAKSRR